MKKTLSIIIATVSIISVMFGFSSTAMADSPKESAALIATSNISFSGSAQIVGDVLISSGYVNAGNGTKSVTGTVYASNKVTVNTKVNNDKKLTVSEYNEALTGIDMPTYAEAPEADYFSNTTSGYTDGTKSINLDWQKPDVVISDNAYIDTLSINNPYNFTVDTSKKSVIVIRVKTLNIANQLKIAGNGNVIIYVDELKNGCNGKINPSGNSNSLNFVFTGNNAGFKGFAEVNANAVAPYATSFAIEGAKFNGNVYTSGDFSLLSSVDAKGYIFAPYSSTKITGSSKLEGKMVTKSLDMNGSTKIKKAEVTQSLPTAVENVVSSSKSEAPTGTKVSVKTLVPRKMSIRLEDGTVLTNKSSFQIPLDKEIKFQMCSNNWDTDSYDDNGNGIAGTVVYKVVVSSKAKKNSYDANSHTFTLCKADKTLRTDNNSCFMAVRYHFSKGDYNKQTGIKNVVNTPTESLSVNLPLGSTITSDAYVKGEKVTSSNVFVETTSDKSLSYTDFYWNY